MTVKRVKGTCNTKTEPIAFAFICSDHCIVIKYLPFVGDSKRAMDEYTSRIFMNGMNTIVLHNTCEDSLLATPLIIDLAVLTGIRDPPPTHTHMLSRSHTSSVALQHYVLFCCQIWCFW